MASLPDPFVPVSTNEELEEWLAQRGLRVVEVHSGFWGPCLAAITMYKKYSVEYEDRPLKFLVACADDIDELAAFRELAEPIFLIYRNGRLMDTVKGSQVPMLVKHVMELTPRSEDDDDLEENDIFRARRDRIQAEQQARAEALQAAA